MLGDENSVAVADPAQGAEDKAMPSESSGEDKASVDEDEASPHDQGDGMAGRERAN